MIGRVRLPEGLAELTRTELERAIYEAALHEDDEYIAREYLVAKRAQVDIAADLQWDRSTISHRLPEITRVVERIAKRLQIT